MNTIADQAVVFELEVSFDELCVVIVVGIAMRIYRWRVITVEHCRAVLYTAHLVNVYGLFSCAVRINVVSKLIVSILCVKLEGKAWIQTKNNNISINIWQHIVVQLHLYNLIYDATCMRWSLFRLVQHCCTMKTVSVMQCTARITTL